MFSELRICQEVLLLSEWRWFMETDAWRRDAVYPS